MVVEVPADSFFDTLLELQRWLPAELLLQLRRVNSIAGIVAKAVGNIGYQAQRVALGVAQDAVYGLNHHLDKIDVLPLVEATDIVGFGQFAIVEDKVDSSRVILDIEPIAHILTLPIDRKRLAVADIVDKERNKLLGELVGTIVVRAVRNDGGQTIGVVVSPHEVVARCLCSRIGAVGVVLGRFVEKLIAVSLVTLRGSYGLEGRLDSLGVVHLQSTIYLVGRDMVEALAFITLWKTLPIELRRLQERDRAHYIGLCEGEGVLNRAVHMAFGSKVDNAVNLLVLHQLIESLEVADIHPHELVVGLILDIFEVCEVARIGEFVEVDDAVLGILVYEQPHNVRANKTRTASDNNITLCHNSLLIFKILNTFF